MRWLALWLLLGALVGCGRGDASGNGDPEPAGAGTVALTAPAPNRGAVHLVRLVARGDDFAFEPAEVSIRRGDVVRFVQTGHLPDAVAFDPAAAPEGGAVFLEGQSARQGPLLTEPGVFFDVSFRDAPAGEYRFFSVPHREFGMEGRIVVQE